MRKRLSDRRERETAETTKIVAAFAAPPLRLSATDALSDWSYSISEEATRPRVKGSFASGSGLLLIAP
jgi:hypothetical protein